MKRSPILVVTIILAAVFMVAAVAVIISSTRSRSGDPPAEEIAIELNATAPSVLPEKRKMPTPVAKTPIDASNATVLVVSPNVPPARAGADAGPDHVERHAGVDSVRAEYDPSFDLNEVIAHGKREADKYDRKVFTAVARAHDSLMMAPGSTDCFTARALRLRRSWLIQTAAEITLEIRGDAASVVDMVLPTPEHPEQWDVEFHRCFLETIRRVKFSCTGCTEGRATFHYPVQRFINITKEDMERKTNATAGTEPPTP